MPRGFNPRKYLELGKVLLVDPAYEEDSRVRTALGRFYYAAFLVALQKLQSEGIPIQDKSKIHKEVIDIYMDEGLSSIGDLLNQLREMRVNADYEMMAEMKLSICRRYASLSERAIDLIDGTRTLR
jgi:uncharacterized protein (UPF0332 family)